jgi:hypothetical protein
MRVVGIRRRVAVAVMGVAAVTVSQLIGVHPAHASSVVACPGTFTITLPATIGTVTAQTYTASDAGSCATVDDAGSPPVFGDVTVGPRNDSNAFTYTGNCAEGSLTFSDGGGGIFLAGIVVLFNGHPGAFVGVVTPSGTPCQGGLGSTMTWTGVGDWNAVTP